MYDLLVSEFRTKMLAKINLNKKKINIWRIYESHGTSYSILFVFTIFTKTKNTQREEKNSVMANRIGDAYTGREIRFLASHIIYFIQIRFVQSSQQINKHITNHICDTFWLFVLILRYLLFSTLCYLMMLIVDPSSFSLFSFFINKSISEKM